MFGQPKPAAALSSGLLARKGQARPAMRPQGYGSAQGPQPSLEDLGWNDLGDAAPPLPSQPALAAPEMDEPEAAVPVPPVLIEREALAEQIEAPAAVRPVSVATAQRLQRETARGDKAAFTLRLDSDRHLRLRLASALSNRSAQQLVTSALDYYLQSLPEVEALLGQLPAAPSRSKKGSR